MRRKFQKIVVREHHRTAKAMAMSCCPSSDSSNIPFNVSRMYPECTSLETGGYRDKDGHYHITKRVDDVINVKGHRLGTAELESAMVGVEKRAFIFITADEQLLLFSVSGS